MFSVSVPLAEAARSSRQRAVTMSGRFVCPSARNRTAGTPTTALIEDCDGKSGDEGIGEFWVHLHTRDFLLQEVNSCGRISAAGER